MRHWRLYTLIGLLALLGGLSALRHQTAYSSPASGPANVAIIRTTSWPVPDAEVEAMVRQAVTLAGGLDGIITPGDTVVVKPNLIWDSPPEEGYTTDPRVARAIVKMAREAGAGEVIIAEGAGQYRDWHDGRGATRQAFRVCGYDANGDMVDDATGAPLIDLNNAGGLNQHDPNLVRQVTLQNGLIWNTYWLPNVILDADVLISIPVLKNHSRAGVTLALKNQFGIAPSDIYHNAGSQMWKGALSHSAADLGRHIVDLNLARPLDFAVIDGLRGITNGPTGIGMANPPMKLIMASRDAVALDTIGALVMGYDPQTVPYLGWAAAAGLGTDNVAQITVRGARVSQVRRDFPAPWGDPQARRAESTPPAITITAPNEGSTVTETVTVQAAASDGAPGHVAKVEFYAGGDLQAVTTTPPYQATLDLSAYHGQSVVLRAVAYDDALNDAEGTRTVAVAQAPASGGASFRKTKLTIPTYPYASHLTMKYNATYNMTYPALNWNTYRGTAATPTVYELLVLENDYLCVTLLPELGGRVYQMTYKPTGHNALYQNPVIKPTHWGPPEQGWWLAVGGIEWCLPVDEHGYEWGTPWSYQVVTSTTGITVTLRDTTATNRLRAAVTVHLPADRATLLITPRIENPTGNSIGYKYWLNASLAPGAANTVGPDLRLIFNAKEVSIHSTGDDRLPGVWPTPISGPTYRISWPVYNGVDFSRLGNWDEWLGFFEYPKAQGSFIGVYDTGVDEGVARIFPPKIARGTKGFGMGWVHKIDPNTWTDDGSTYVELHGGVAPTFWDQAVLPSGQALAWTEVWYPLSGIGTLSAATEEAALGVRESGGTLSIAVHATRYHADGATSLHVWNTVSRSEIAQWRLPAIEPGNPFKVSTTTGGRPTAEIAIMYLDDENNLLLAGINAYDFIPPSAWIEPLPPWVGTADFTVSWSGEDIWSGIAAYDVQVRDGYEATWRDWMTGTTALSATFTGAHGHTYFFRARARDQLGTIGTYTNEEWGQAFTTVLTTPAPVLVTSRKAACAESALRPCLLHPGQAASYTITISNTGNLTAAAALTDTLPTGTAVLTETLAATSGPAPTYADGQIRWSGPAAPGSEIRVTYALSPTAIIPLGQPLTNTVEIEGSALGLFTRQETVALAYVLWMPLALK